MESFWIKALQLIVALLVLVTVHEFGHYIFARIFGVKVNRFYLFFNPWFSLLKYYPDKGKLELIAWTTKKTVAKGDSAAKDQTETDASAASAKKDEEVEEVPHALFTFKVGKPHSDVNKKGKPSWAATMYGLGWLPLGGYCDIAGMVDETKGADDLAAEPQPWEFRSQAVWKRFMIMVAGVLFNFILAILIYAGIALHWGDRAVQFQDAYEGMDYAQPMLNAGFQNGDILLAINGEKADIINGTPTWDMMQPGARVAVIRNHVDTVYIDIPKNMLMEAAELANETRTSPMTFRVPAYIDKLVGGAPAKEAGLKEGDRIIKIGNDTTPALTEFYPAIAKYPETTVPFRIIRDGREMLIPVTPDENGKIGIQLRSPADIYPITEVHYSLLGSIPRGWELGTNQLSAYVSSLKLLATKTGVQQVGGFGTLGSLFPDQWNWRMFWEITAFLSVILAFMNIIPIPGLDGGHVLFLIIEMVTRRKLSDKFLETANFIGMAFLVLLLLYANGNDILRAFK